MALSRDIKVGTFVLLGLIATGVVIFLIGDERGMFVRKHQYTVVFSDVEGLKRGSMVRMGGIDVGAISSVRYSDDATNARLYVTIAVAQDEARRIRQDSVATIEAKGLLGDKMISISVGNNELPQLQPGSTIPSDETGGIGQMLSRVNRIGEHAERVMVNLESTTDTIAGEEFRQDLQSAVASLSGILKAVDEGDGYAARIVKDPAEAQRISRTLANLEQTSARLRRTAEGVNQIVDRITNGPGFAHQVIYGDAPTETLEQFGHAAEEVALTLRGIRDGNGPVRSLLYGGGPSEDMMGNITAMSRDLRQIVADVRSGKGTIGALLVDPSVYEDLKILLGNVQRNRTLRALVRYSIRRDERAPGVEVRDAVPATETAARRARRSSRTATSRSDSGPASGRDGSAAAP